MLSKKIKIFIGIGLIIIILIVLGYIFRVDRYGRSKISWVDCVQIKNTKYYSGIKRSPIDSSIIGKKIGEVKFNISENVSNSNYKFRNGDATFLEVGTEIFSLQAETNEIAVRIGDNYFSYRTPVRK